MRFLLQTNQLFSSSDVSAQDKLHCWEISAEMASSQSSNALAWKCAASPLPDGPVTLHQRLDSMRKLRAGHRRSSLREVDGDHFRRLVVQPALFRVPLWARLPGPSLDAWNQGGGEAITHQYRCSMYQASSSWSRCGCPLAHTWHQVEPSHPIK